MDYTPNRTRMQRGSCYRMATTCPVNKQNVISSADCPCGDQTISVERTVPPKPVGIAYVTVQTFGEVYPPQKALTVGTVFACLDYPFSGTCCLSGTARGGRL